MSNYSTVLWDTDIVDVSFDSSKSTKINNERLYELSLYIDSEDIKQIAERHGYLYLQVCQHDNFPRNTRYELGDIKRYKNDKYGLLILFKEDSETYNKFKSIHEDVWKNGETQVIDYSFLTV